MNLQSSVLFTGLLNPGIVRFFEVAMKYLPTAFHQLEFAFKLYGYGKAGRIDAHELDKEVIVVERYSRFVLNSEFLEDPNNLEILVANNLRIAGGAAAITLNRAIEECGLRPPQKVESERDQFVVLVAQIRNCFAHDIVEPKWEIRNPALRRAYEVGLVKVDLTDMHGVDFDYYQIGGVEALFRLRDYAVANVFPEYQQVVDLAMLN